VGSSGQAVSAVSGWVDATEAALSPLARPSDATAMRAYMKDVAPFLGVKTPERRAALRRAWRPLGVLEPAELAEACVRLWWLPEREYQYAACDLIARHVRSLPGAFVVDPVQSLLTTKPWWDTVDALGTAAVTPVVARSPDLVPLMWQWLESGDRWLVRAAIQHQRGRAEGTDLDRLLAMCDRCAADREFFVAKAVGWALRDVTAWDPAAVRRFVDDHPDLSTVARREAARGLARSARP
jgi:3-methyladenine DNA glycosylase AlkD